MGTNGDSKVSAAMAFNLDTGNNMLRRSPWARLPI